MFVTFEGLDGAGKTTQAELLRGHVVASGREVVATREPGGTPLGERVRALLLNGEDMTAWAEAALFAAARAELVERVIAPALERGATVICDRYVDSTLAYQGVGRGLPLDTLRSVQQLPTAGLLPDLRVLLDVPAAVGLARRYAAPEEVNRLDAAGTAFHERVRQAYLDLAAADPSGWVVVDAAGAEEEVARRVVGAVQPRLVAAAGTA